MEGLMKQGVDVLYCFEPLDEVVFSNVREFDGKQFVSIETSQVDIDPDAIAQERTGGLTSDEAKSFCTWLKDTLGE